MNKNVKKKLKINWWTW